jgi:DNA-binding MarR family transcriptional regulator
LLLQGKRCESVAVTRSTPRPPANQRFGYRINMLSAALSQHRLLQVRREFEINLAEYRTLSRLMEFDSPSIRDIAKHTQLDKGNVTRALARLIKRRLVSQIIHREDRRLRVVELTAAGRRIVTATEPFTIERQERLKNCLTRSELRIFWKALTLLTAEAERMLAEEQRKGARRRLTRGSPDHVAARG